MKVHAKQTIVFLAYGQRRAPLAGSRLRDSAVVRGFLPRSPGRALPRTHQGASSTSRCNLRATGSQPTSMYAARFFDAPRLFFFFGVVRLVSMSVEMKGMGLVPPGALPGEVTPSAATLASVRQALLDWYSTAKRDLPWRGSDDPYKIWISEVMAQQTRVDVVAPYYERFLARFPTVEALASAAEDEVLGLWSGLGYYSRARRLCRAAAMIVERYGGIFPAFPDACRSLPGVGDYTAGAILSIAFGQREAAVDGNVRRVLSRLFPVATPPGEVPAEPATPGSLSRKALRALATRLSSPARPGDLNQALMELGALVCTPRRPRCEDCPLASTCQSQGSAAVSGIPARRPRRATEPWNHLAVLVRSSQGRPLLIRRDSKAPFLPGLWHLPALFLPVAGEALPLDRFRVFLAKRWGIELTCESPIAVVRHQITYRSIRASLFPGRLAKDLFQGADVFWPSDAELRRLATSSLVTKLLDAAKSL